MAESVRHTARAEEGTQNRRPFLGLHPGLTVPPTFLLIGTRVPAIRPCLLGSRLARHRFGRGALILSIGIASSDTSGLELLLLLTSWGCSKQCPQKTEFSTRRFNGSAFGCLLLPHIRFTANSAAPVGSFCQSRLCISARRKPKTVPCSLPRTSALLRSCGIFRDAVIAIVAHSRQARTHSHLGASKCRLDHRTKQRRAAGPSPGVRFPLPHRIPAPRRKILARDCAGAQYQHSHGAESVRR